MFDYETLKLIWWVLVGLLLIGFALTDGFDMGAMAIMPFVAKTDMERRVAINCIAPHWDGNQVWFITAGGAIFAAWPIVYATAFSGMYWALLLVLFALFMRPVGFDYRGKFEQEKTRNLWDIALAVGGAVPALVFGVAFGNLFLGVPFEFDDLLRSTYTGSFFALLNPFALLTGVVSLAMLCLHGATWLLMRTDGHLHQRTHTAVKSAALVYLVAFIGAGLWLSFGIEGYTLTQIGDINTNLNIVNKTVLHTGNMGWLNNYQHYPITKIAPVLGLLGALLALFAASKHKAGLAFLGSSLAIVGTILTAGFALFPFVMPSSSNLASSLTTWDAASSEKTLNVMLVATCIFLPIVISYTLWCYRKMWGKLNQKTIDSDTHGFY